jgi:hypothetical protein
MISSLDSPMALLVSGSEEIVLSVSLFTAVISETPQRPPSTLSA